MSISRKILCAVVAIALLSGIVAAINPFPAKKVSAEEYRGGFSIEPQNSDATGVQPDSSFIIKSKNEITLEELAARLSIDGEPVPDIKAGSDGSFIIQPVKKLEYNKLYTFRLVDKTISDAASDAASDTSESAENVIKDTAEDISAVPATDTGSTDITWTFQTSAPFRILGVLPSDKSSNVPVNSGIEIYFSHEGFTDADNYFEITPKVNGRFEIHKKALVFVPDKLTEATFYTVRIKKGLKLSGTDYSLENDYVFSFETGMTETGEKDYYDRFKGYFSYNKGLNEYTPSEKPWIPFYYYVNQERVKDSTLKIHTTIYGYNNIDTFVQALEKRDTIPSWAYFNYRKNAVLTSGLTKTLEFDQEFSKDPRDSQFITVPSALPAGFYLVDSKWDNIQFQTFIQVTEIGMYIMKAENKTLVWLNDLVSQKPLENANLVLSQDNGAAQQKTEFISNAEGIAFFDSPGTSETAADTLDNENNDSRYLPQTGSNTRYFTITAKDGRAAVLAYQSYSSGYYDMYYGGYYGGYNGGSGNNLYWNYFQLDRNLYKPDDTVNFWGMLKERYQGTSADPLTVEIGKSYSLYRGLRSERSGGKTAIDTSYYYPYQFESQSMIKQTVTAENGIFEGSIKLPVLEPGGYSVTLKSGGKTISSTYISVENFSKPAYKVDISKDKEAIFAGQEVNFTIKASFFEGTGIPGLDINYNIGSLPGDKAVSGNIKTNQSGEIPVKYIPEPAGEVQGENYAGLYCYATLPEIGEISQNSSIRVFVNDIYVAVEGFIKNGEGTITATVNKIVLDRLNNGTSKDNSDYKGETVASKVFEGTIYKNTWVKVEDGQYYDFINKVSRVRYRYDLKKEALKKMSMVTGTDGKATFTFAAPETVEGYYTAELRCMDNSGRSMKFEVYIGQRYAYDYNYEENRYYLVGQRENWKLGETAGLIFKKGKEALQGPGFLYIETQNGIREYKTSQSSDYSFIMEESDIPNVYVTGVFFNGTTYIESELFSAVYDYNGKKLEITAETDKSSYKPGETATIRITARNAEGLPVKAAVNASIVDEALFRLSGQEIDTLAALYSQITSGISFTYVSHLNSGKDILEAPVAQNSQMKSTSATEMAEISPSRDESKSRTNLNIAFGGAGSDNSYIREVFKDTAFFDTILLDENGKGELNLKLPDNVTSWRITLSGLSSDLRAGSGKTALDVSLPFFVNYTLNETYLEGDIPILGVSAYGKSLADGKSVVFEVSSKNNPGLKTKAEGKAFERVNIPLWQFKSGKDQIMIRAYTSGGLEDNIKHNVRILSTYHQAEKAIYYKASPDMKIEGGSSGNTTLVFSDAGRGAFLNDLTGLMYTAGNRIDQRLSSMIAIDLLKKYFIKEKEGTYWLESGVDTDTALKVSDYQTEDGGIALLPYGSSDPDISAKLSPYIKDEIDQFKLKQYFYTVLGSDSSGLKGSALYGLAVLREPVLIDIKKAASTENAGVSDLTWLALALSELGETWEADRLYTERIAPYLQKLEPYYRINTGKDNDDILECTSLAAVLASVLNKAEKEGLYSYCTENMTEDILINIERLMYISSELKKTGESISRLTYELLGEKHSSVLENGGGFTLTIPSVNLTDFHISSVEGNISAVSIFQAPLTVPANTDASINVQRMYSALNSLASSTDSISGKTGSDSNGTDTYRFNHNDIIKVELSWEMGAKALDGTYEITDFLPSGLKAIENTVNYKTDSSGNYYYGRIDGQKIRFYVYNSHEKTANRTLWYYARVISSGIYKADGTLIQSVSSRVSLNTGNTDMVEISGLSGF